MAQTITQQKGSVSTTWDDSVTTLFTLSSGTASRVILNSLSANVTNTLTSVGQFYANVWFYIYNSSMGARNPIAGAYAVGSGIAWLPGNTSGPTNMQSNGTYSRNSSAGLITSDGAAGSIGSKTANNVGWNITTDVSAGCYFPAQFWMGNGDSLQVKGNWGPNNPGTVYYSFTLVTES